MASIEKFLLEALLQQPKSTKINTKAFLLEAYEALMQDKKFSKKALRVVYHKVIDSAKDPILMGKLFGRQGKDFQAANVGHQARKTK